MENQQNIFDAIRQVVRDEMQPIREEFSQKLDTVLISNDKIAKELKDLRQEVIMFNGGQRRQDDQLQEYGHRLSVVETKAGI